MTIHYCNIVTVTGYRKQLNTMQCNNLVNQIINLVEIPRLLNWSTMSFSVTYTIYKATHFTFHIYIYIYIYIIYFIPLVSKYFLSSQENKK